VTSAPDLAGWLLAGDAAEARARAATPGPGGDARNLWALIDAYRGATVV
jgi:hypothetical protein